MVSAKDVSKHFGSQVVLRSATFRIHPGERVGLVGPNGAGKSTLFALIRGEVSPDSGSVAVAANARIGHLRQEFNPHEVTSTLIEYAESGRQDLIDLHDEIHVLERELAHPDARDRQARLAHLGRLQTLFEASGGYTTHSRAAAALCGLGLTEEQFARPFSSFSGGWQMRAELARVLVTDPDLLLLDEPTNYLDIPAIEWLRDYLRNFSGTMLLISHDRYLLSTLTTTTLEVANGTTDKYKGNYDYYVKERELRFEQRLAAAKNQQREREQAQLFINRFRAKNTKATLVQSKIKMLERMEEVVIPQRVNSPGKIRLRKPTRCGHAVVTLDGIGLSYDGATFVLRNLSLAVENGDKVAFVGLNGTGKSTLLRILAGKLPPTEGRCVLGHNVIPGYQSQEFAETMDPDRTVFDTLKDVGGDATTQDIRNLLGGFGFSGSTVEKPVAVLSGGEKIRLAFARLLINPPNFLILDEPTTHLDIAARESLEAALQDFPGTLCVVSHDIQFVRRVATRIVAMRPPGVRLYCGNYDYYCDKLQLENATASPAQSIEEIRESDRKTQRRERAADVQERARQRRDITAVLVDAERQIDALEQEEKDLAATLQEPDPKLDYARTFRRIREIHHELPILMETWQNAAEQLEKLP
jgi:ATP-binding cassette subfamily F protein 3